MSLLWVKVAKQMTDDEYDDYYGHPRSARETNYAEDHNQHGMSPAFEAAGIKHAPCAFSLCNDVDWDHSDAFDEAEDRFFKGQHEPHRLDLSQPVHGFEATADMHTLRRYTKHPESRGGNEPSVFRFRGKTYIHNGHHGIAAALRRGDSHIDTAMVDLDQAGWKP